MKRALTVLLLLSALAVSGLVWAHNSLSAAGDDVVITGDFAWGDVSAAEGVTVTARSTADYHLFWDTAYTFGAEPACETAFSFAPLKRREEYAHVYDGVRVESYLECGVGGERLALEEALADSPLLEAALSLAERTAAGETETETVALGDIMDYYPIIAFVDMPDLSADFSFSSDIFAEYFKIPVMPTHLARLSVTKDEAGNVISFDASSSGEGFGMNTVGAVAEGSCYFTFSPRSSEGAAVDTSLISGGYGLYRFTPAGETLETVYPLDIGEKPIELLTDPSGERLLLFTERDEKVLLTVIDIATMSRRQSLEAAALPGGVWNCGVYDRGSFLVVDTGEELALLDTDGSGSYARRLLVDTFPAGVPTAYYSVDASMSWDGERLCIAGPSANYHDATGLPGGTNTYNCGFFLNVYDRRGLLYSGSFRSSLDTDLPQDSRYTNRSREAVPVALPQ